MNKFDNIMIGNKTLEQIKADSVISQINTMIKNREIMDEIELVQAVSDAKIFLNTQSFDLETLRRLCCEGWVQIDEDIYDKWVNTVNSGREEALSYKDHKKSPFDSDSEEVQEARLNYNNFKNHLEFCIENNQAGVWFSNPDKYYLSSCLEEYQHRKHYTKDMPSLYNITEEKFHQLVREGYDCWDVECFQDPEKLLGKIFNHYEPESDPRASNIKRSDDPRYDWESFKGCLYNSADSYFKYLYVYENEYFCFSSLDMDPSDYMSIKINKDICQERFVALVDKGYNVFEVTQEPEIKNDDPRYDFDDFMRACKAAIHHNHPVVYRDGKYYVYSHSEIPDGAKEARFCTSGFETEEQSRYWFKNMVDIGVEYFNVY